MRKTFLLLIPFLFTSINKTEAQKQYRYPLDIPVSLSANFGELRPNHFHSGLDLRTQQVINKPVYSIADGYVSRISVSPSGYGLAIYIDHPSGETSVYGHLQRFAPVIANYIKEKQYENESYKLDISIDKGILPVKKGDLVAYSGNTGSSGGPHVHFEIRETSNQHALDPLIYYKSIVKDTQCPVIKAIAIYPTEGKGAVNGGRNPLRKSIPVSKNGAYLALKETINAWGTIGIGVNAIDKMDGTSSVFGIKKLKLFCDNKEIFSSDMTEIDFSTTRMINSYIDFDFWSNNKIFYMKSFLEPGNKLSICKAHNNGYINIDKEKTYNFRYELEDLWSNKTSYSFSIVGKKQEIPALPLCSLVMAWDQNNHYITESFSLVVPKEKLYTDLCFILKQAKTENYLSDLYRVHTSYVPLNSYVDMKIKLNKDVLTNTNQYGVVLIKNGKESWVGGQYEDGYVNAKIREFGNTYAISFDKDAPVITPVLPEKWVEKKEIKIKLVDEKSGINSFKGTIDGQFALFAHDVKSNIYTYKFDPERLKSGKIHQLIFIANDECGNSSKYEYEFKY